MTDTALRFGVPANGATEASDSEFLAAVHWRSSNPGISSELGSDSDVRAIGMCWKHHGLSLNWPKGLERRFRTLDELSLDESAGSLVLCLAAVRETTLKKKQKTATAGLLDEWLSSNSDSLADPLILLSCCELLILHAEQLPAATVGRLWRATLCGALDLSEAFEKATGNDDWDEQAVDIEDSSREWITGGLLPWACGLLFDEVKGAPKVARAARSAIHKQLESVAVDEGCPDGTVLDGLPVLLASLHDAALIGHLFERPVWKTSTQRSWLTLLKNSAALLAADGHMTVEAADPARGAQLVASASTFSETAGAWSALAAKLTSPKVAGSKKKQSKKTPATSTKRKVRRQDIPSWQSDEAEVACLRTTWDESASIASISHHGDLPFLELVVDGVTLLRGDWGLTVAEDGEILEFEPAWENVCWHSEPEVDYCELQFEFEGGPKICRHVMLSRQHQFAILSDVVTETSAKELQWETSLPLADGVSVKTHAETREHVLKAGSKIARVFPLILPQDLRDGTAGAMGVSETEDGEFLALRCPSSSGALFAPIVIDWSQENRKAPAEWKRLTTTTAGEIDLTGSAAYRLQFGKRHLMLYRSLVETKRYRAMVGYQTDHETILADFKDGEIDEIVMVE